MDENTISTIKVKLQNKLSQIESLSGSSVPKKDALVFLDDIISYFDAAPTPEPNPNPTPTAGYVGMSGERFTLNGKVWYPIADTGWTLISQSKTDVITYLNDRQARGFNTIKFGKITNGAFYKTVKSPNANFWNMVCWIIEQLAARGMFAEFCVCPTITYKNYIPYTILPATEWNALGKYVGTLLKKYSNIWSYVVDGLDNRLNQMGDLQQIAKGLKATDPNRLVSYHPKHGYQSTDFYKISSIHNYCWAQSGHTVYNSDTNVLNLQKRAPRAVPWYDGEPLYDHQVVGGHNITPADISRIANAGIPRKAGITYGSLSMCVFATGKEIILGNKSYPWKTILGAPGVAEVINASKKLKNLKSGIKNSRK